MTEDSHEGSSDVNQSGRLGLARRLLSPFASFESTDVQLNQQNWR
jgi:hypothetical protein